MSVNVLFDWEDGGIWFWFIVVSKLYRRDKEEMYWVESKIKFKIEFKVCCDEYNRIVIYWSINSDVFGLCNLY